MPRLKRFDSVMVALIAKHGFPGASLAMAREGRLVFARGYGFADLKSRAPVRPAMQFGIGSVSKTITAVAVLKLFESGKLGRDDRAFEILSDLKPLAGAKVDPGHRRITVRMLLNHSSGYEDGTHVAAAAQAFGIARDDLTADQLVRYGLGRPLEYAPGTEARYSNAGYVVLGQIVARLSGQPYEDYVTRQVLAPLGIRHAALGSRSKTYPADWVHRYDHQGKELDPLPPAAGFWVTSTVELIRFITSVGGSRAAIPLSVDSQGDVRPAAACSRSSGGLGSMRPGRDTQLASASVPKATQRRTASCPRTQPPIAVTCSIASHQR
jgi:CubicO group peptidase (beta-lactamase class C family)